MPEDELRLEPMSMGEIFDKAIRIYKGNFKVLLAAFAAVYIPVMIIRILAETLVVNQYFLDQLDFASYGLVFYLQDILYNLPRSLQVFIVIALTSIPITKMTVSFMKGRTATVRQAYRGATGYWKRLIGAYGLLAGLLLAVLVWTVVPIAGWFSGPGMFLMLFFVASQLLAVIIILEDCGISTAVRRAWQLARVRFWWLFTFTVAAFLFKKWIAASLFALSEFIFFAILAATPALEGTAAFTYFKVMQVFLNMVSDMLTLPISIIIILLLYLDLRVRAEGLDLQVRASSTFNLLPAEKSNDRLTRHDWVNLAWVSTILLTVIGLLYYYPDEGGAVLFLFSFLLP